MRADHPNARLWLERSRATLAATLDEPVIDACLFGWTAPLVGATGPLGAGVANVVARRRAGGLPERFALVLTPARLRAYGLAGDDGDIDPEIELGAWERSELTVSAATRGTSIEVLFTIGERQIAIHAAVDERARAFVRQLGAIA